MLWVWLAIGTAWAAAWEFLAYRPNVGKRLHFWLEVTAVIGLALCLGLGALSMTS